MFAPLKIVFLATVLSLVVLFANAQTRRLRPVDTRFTMETTNVSSDQISVGINIPYNGMIEFRLFNYERKLVGRDQYISNMGDNNIRYRFKELPSGTYQYVVSYKGRSESNLVVIP